MHGHGTIEREKGKRGFRYWLNFGGENKYPKPSIHVEAYVGRPVYLIGAYVDVQDDYDSPVAIGLYLYPFSIYVGGESKFLQRIAGRLVRFSNAHGTQRRYPDDSRELKLVFSREDKSLCWNLWLGDSTWYSDDPKWRRGRWSPVDALLGGWEYSKEIISKHDVAIPMPEKAYAATVELEQRSWHRKRFAFIRKSKMGAHIDIPGGIPHEGKGENAYDCGEDALFSMSCQAESLHEAIGSTVAAVMRYRIKYGGSIYHRQESAA